MNKFLKPLLALLVMASPTPAPAVSPLFTRGYTVLPAPQSVTLAGTDFSLTSGWQLELTGDVKADDVAAETLKEDLATRYGLTSRKALPPRAPPE